MCNWLYTLRERFTPNSAKGWTDYLAFSGFRNVVEVVTVDSILCPDIITDFADADWSHNVHEDFRLTLFRDPDYLRHRQPLNSSRHQLLAILEHPDGSENVPSMFTRCGFDIMDSYFGNSALTNCGPIPEAFDPSIVNEFGLLSDCETAIAVRNRMRHLQPNDPHLGHCEVWLIARVLFDE